MSAQFLLLELFVAYVPPPKHRQVGMERRQGICGIVGSNRLLGCKVVPKPEPLPERTTGRVAIAEATKAFLDDLKETAAFATHKKYRLLMARLNKFSAGDPRMVQLALK